MKRRAFVTGAIGAGGAVAASGFPAPAIAQERFEWTIVTTWPAGFPELGVCAQRFAGCVAAMSEGRLTIRDRPHPVGW